MQNKSNRTKYQFLAPVYDRLLGNSVFRDARRRAVDQLSLRSGDRVLLVGVGTGEDLPFLPPSVVPVGIDLSDDMLAVARAKFPTADLRVMNAERLDFPDASFDKVLLSLVLSVVEHPDLALAEALRVLKPDGAIVVFDKFLPSGQAPTLLRRAINVITSKLGTDINRRYEDIAAGLPVRPVLDEPSIFTGRYRILLLEKQQPPSRLPEFSHATLASPEGEVSAGSSSSSR